MMTIAERLRDVALFIESGGVSTLTPGELREAAADIERLALFEHYANSVIEGQVLDAIEQKKRTGKYPFED